MCEVSGLIRVLWSICLGVCGWAVGGNMAIASALAECGLLVRLFVQHLGDNTVSNKTVPITNPNTVCEVHCNHTWEFPLALV